MRLLDRHVTLFSGSLRTLLQRESDRRRCADSPYAWLFQPYMGEESVALVSQSSLGGSAISVAAVMLSPLRIHTSQAWVATLASSDRVNDATLRYHSRYHGTGATIAPSAENLGALAEFIGNRPLVGWQLEQSIEHLNGLFREQLGFGLPNAQVDVAKLHQRHLRRLHPQLEERRHLRDALASWQLPGLRWPDVLSEATASALLYLRLQREVAHAG